MGMENMCFALADYPEEFREMMDRLARITLPISTFWKRRAACCPLQALEKVAQGSLCFTEDCPARASSQPGMYGDSWTPRRQ